MPTLIWAGKGNQCTGRCDSRCHNAKWPECLCICGGRYHSAARDGTLEEKLKETEREFVESLKEKGVDVSGLEQMMLPGTTTSREE